MPTEPKRPLIVISYAHEDEPEKPAEGEVKWLSFATGYLRPAIKHFAVDLWLDRLMTGGADWEREIDQKLRSCDIFILLVSRHSLSSDYVVDKEIAIIRERQARGDDVHFYPLVLTPTPKIALDLVRDKNLRPRDGKPLSEFSINERYRQMNEAADEIAEIAAKIVERGTAAASLGAPAQFTNRASLEIWARGQNRETALAIAARAALRVVPIGIVRLPGAGAMGRMSNSMSAIFRAAAVAWVSGKFSTRADELQGSALAAAAQAIVASEARAGARFVSYAQSAAEAAARVAGYAVDAADARGADAANAADAAASALANLTVVLDIVADVIVGDSGRTSAPISGGSTSWHEVSKDIEVAHSRGASALLDMPLWSGGTPKWVSDAWADIRRTYPQEQGWEIWFDWYEERLRGGSHGEDYELVFASVPQEEWDRGPAAANAWINERLPRDEARREPGVEIRDSESLIAWLAARGRVVKVAIATRAALRVAPLAILAAKGETDETGAHPIQTSLRWTSAIFRATALGRVMATHPTRAGDFGPAARRAGHAATGEAALFVMSPYTYRDPEAIAAAALYAAGSAARAADPGDLFSIEFGTEAADAAAAAFNNTDSGTWRELLADVDFLRSHDPEHLMDLPLWSRPTPTWATSTWSSMVASVMTVSDMDVWIDWYEERLRGGSRGEDYELVFTSVPQAEWDKGPAAANVWIKAHLPREETPNISDPLALQAWLSEQPRESAIVIAVRAALRVAPLVARVARTGLDTPQQHEIAGFASAVFRAAACTSASAKYARPAHDSLDLARAVESANGSMQTALEAKVPEVVILAISTAGTSGATAVAVPSASARSAAATASNFAIAFRLADASLYELEANRVAWNHIALDAETAKRIGPQALLDSPLWLRDEPRVRTR